MARITNASAAKEILKTLSDRDILLLCPIPEPIIRCPVIPHRRETEFLQVDAEEVLFGGAVGGGKTEALLLWLLEGIAYPNFSGLFLRRTFAQLKGSPTSPIERSWKFFGHTGATWNSTEKVWTWPNGAMVRFGHMQHENDKHNYDGPEFHRVVFDQVEQFSESQYTYMFSRLRRIKDYPIGCGIRSSANPVGGNWVKQRFVTQEAIRELSKYTAYDPSPPGMLFTADNGAVFVPARIADNPSLEVEEYINRLREKLGSALAAKLANGDWSAVEGAIVQAEDLRYYGIKGASIYLPEIDRIVPNGQLTRFATIDTAGTSKQKAAESRGKPPSWSVCAIWDHSPTFGLFLRAVYRERVGWPALRDEIQSFLKEWGNPLAVIENAHHGQILAAELRNTRLINPKIPGMGGGEVSGAKYDRAVASGLLRMIAKHEFYLPDVGTVQGAASWMPEFESELLGWSGHPDETSDQIDVCSYASDWVKQRRGAWGGVIDARAVSTSRRF